MINGLSFPPHWWITITFYAARQGRLMLTVALLYCSDSAKLAGTNKHLPHSIWGIMLYLATDWTTMLNWFALATLLKGARFPFLAVHTLYQLPVAPLLRTWLSYWFVLITVLYLRDLPRFWFCIQSSCLCVCAVYSHIIYITIFVKAGW